MALSLSDIQNRMSNELRLLGVPTAAKADIIKDALTKLMAYIRELCRISATLSVSSSTDIYDVPATIDIVSEVKNSAGAGVVYSVDTKRRKITLQDTETSAVSYTVYGTPKDVRTNYSTIIAALPESYGESLWSYVVAGSHKQAMSERYADMLNDAKMSAHELLMYLNDEPGYKDRTIAIVDVTGSRVGDSSAQDGIDYEITSLGETEEFDPN